MLNKIRILLRRLIHFMSSDLDSIFDKKNLISSKNVDYVTSMYELFKKTRQVPGHIFEFGVGNGRNSIIFGKMIKNHNLTFIKKYFGFDFFDKKESPLSIDLNLANDLMISNGIKEETNFIKGDLKLSLETFLKSNHGFREGMLLISLIYIDLNKYEVSKYALNKLKNFISKGAIIAVDESKTADDTKALREFCEENKLIFKSGDFGPHISSYTIFDKEQN